VLYRNARAALEHPLVYKSGRVGRRGDNYGERLCRPIDDLPGLRLRTADRPDDGIIGHQRVERL
jgi:hypothetical protein